MDDPWNDPGAQDWLHHVRTNVLPMVEDSSVCISLCPDGPPDIKFSVELGMMIMLDKPILIVAAPGQVIPRKLALVADRVVYADITTPRGRMMLMDTLSTLEPAQGDEP